MPSAVAVERRRRRHLLLLPLCFGLALWLEMFLNRAAPQFGLMAFGPVVALAAWSAGLVPALTVIVASAVCADLLLLEPGSLFTFGGTTQALVVAGFTAAWAGSAVAVSALWRRAERESEENAAAQRAANQARRLAQSTAALAQARNSREVIDAAVQEGLHCLAADAGIFLVVGEDAQTLTPARTIGYHFPTDQCWDLETLGRGSPLLESMRLLVPIVVHGDDERPQAYASWAAAGPWGTQQASVIMPVVVDRRVVGFVQVDFASARELTVDDHEYVQVLSSRTAQALSRTWRHEAVERARLDAESLKARADAELVERQKTEQALRASETRYRALATRTTRLHALTASLSGAVSVRAVAAAIVEQARVVVGANEAELKLADDEDAAFERGTCASDALETAQPVFVGSFEEHQDAYWRSAALNADKGVASTASLPLIVNDAPIGVLEFHFSAPVNFDEEYQALLISVARHCAHALDRARLYEQAQRARADAEEANRLKDEFVSTVSHELRTPLNAILGWASMLRTASVDEHVVPQAVESIHRNASRQAKLVDDLLDFSRMAGGRMTLDLETIDAPALVRGIVESVVPLGARSQISIALDDVPEATLQGDVRRLEQVFVNLLGNALKFTPPGGHIMVSGRMAGRNLEIRVADDGIGIDPSFLPHVFDRFRQGDSTTTRNHAGLGLGLSIARQLVEAHKGSIRAESGGLGAGAAFIVSLPVQSRSTEAPRDIEPPAAEPRLDGIRVLVVDDEKDARDVIGRALEDRGARITVADNSHTALQILSAGEFDVLLADIAMPGEDGYALIEQIRAAENSSSSIPAAAVTAHAREDERRRALAAGFHVHLAKPVEPHDLVRTVNHLIHDRRRGRRSTM